MATILPFPHDPAIRGYLVSYRPRDVNHCPGCGRSHWLVGRAAAECFFCGTALPLAAPDIVQQRFTYQDSF